MFTSCWALAYAIEWSERTFAAIAALIGAATFALISDIAARSGSSSPASSLSSSRVSVRYSCGVVSLIVRLLVPLRDVPGLLRVRVGDRVVREDVQRHGGVDRRGDVRVDERHRRPLGQLLAGERLELLPGEGLVFLRWLRRCSPLLSVWVAGCRRPASCSGIGSSCRARRFAR